MKTNYESEKEFFDEVASSINVQPMSNRTLERYASPQNPRLFCKEMMFSLLGSSGLKILEIGCGEGVTSIQLAYCGHDVVGVDISPKSIEVAKKRAQIENLSVQFKVANVVTDDVFGESQYDVVWCDSVLHHLIGDLSVVMERLSKSLKKGGLFVSTEPIAYATWLKQLRRLVPVKTPATPDEQPLRPKDFAVILSLFPDLSLRYYRILARIDRVTGNLRFIRFAARIDNIILFSGIGKPLAGTAVMWARKQ